MNCTLIGKTTDDGRTKIFEKGKLEADVPVDVLTDPPLYRLEGVQSDLIKELQSFDLTSIPLTDKTPNQVLLELLASSNICSRRSVFRRYDHQVQTNTVIGPGNDGALIRIKGTTKGLSAATDGNGRLCYLDPYIGGLIAVAEACRNVSCTGAVPIALTNCLNFGNPEKADVYYQLEECIKGISDASKAFESPVISGNVSLYNETHGEPIYPTPVIGAVGLTENVDMNCNNSFKSDGDIVILLGSDSVEFKFEDLSGSEYLALMHHTVAGRPSIDLDREILVQKVCRDLIGSGIVSSAHDCSDGGIAVALAESSINSYKGFEGNFDLDGRWDIGLFGEAQSRIIVSLTPENLGELESMCESFGVGYCVLGKVSGEKRFVINNLIDIDLELLANTSDDALVDVC